MNTNQENVSFPKRILRVGFALLLFLGLFAPPTPVLACSCGTEFYSPAEEFSQANAVFEGEVTQIYEFGDGYRVAFVVTRSWKGISTSTVEISTGTGVGDCGYIFNVGASYVVYAYGEPNTLGTTSCSRTTDISRAAEDLSYLDSVQRRQVDTISLSVVGSLLFLAMIWLLRRQRRTPL